MSRSRIFRKETDKSDHVIDLIDNTSDPDRDSIPTNASPALDSATKAAGEASLSKKSTKVRLKDELLRHKYRKWQERDIDNSAPSAESSDHDDDQFYGGNKVKPKKQSMDRGRLRDKIPFRTHKKRPRERKPKEYETDVLYENQRGLFFFGIPLFSAQSLLNFDPSQWQTSAFRTSPVNINNAQLPDPSWAWVSKSWYVDMSRDVDDEGWQYSFSFRHTFSWHGNHPWFHSFVRRRRWLRQRVKLPFGISRGVDGTDVDILTADYFTINTTRNMSRGSDTRTSTYVENQQPDSGSEDDEEIDNILTLMKTFKGTIVDRKKQEALENFLEHGKEDLNYLPEYMQEIMAGFTFQESRQQLLSYFEEVSDRIKEHREQHKADGKPESEAETMKVNVLVKAIPIAQNHVKDLEYWSDVKKISHNANQDETDSNFENTTSQVHHGHNSYEGIEIKGIPDNAGINEEPSIIWSRPDEKARDKEIDISRSKGKGKAQ